MKTKYNVAFWITMLDVKNHIHNTQISNTTRTFIPICCCSLPDITVPLHFSTYRLWDSTGYGISAPWLSKYGSIICKQGQLYLGEAWNIGSIYSKKNILYICNALGVYRQIWRYVLCSSLHLSLSIPTTEPHWWFSVLSRGRKILKVS
jgi:hypothetical protein